MALTTIFGPGNTNWSIWPGLKAAVLNDSPRHLIKGIDLMKSRLLAAYSIAICLLTTWPLAYAKDSHSHAKPHVHGLAELTLIAQGNALEIEFSSPAYDLIGFEHQAQSKQEVESVQAAINTLKKLDSLLIFSNKPCTLVKASVNTADLLAQSGKKSNVSHTHPDHGHDKTHQHEGHRNYHNEFTAYYQLNCSKPVSDSTLTVNLFDVYPSIQQIKVQWVLQNRQGANTLTPQQRTIKLK